MVLNIDIAPTLLGLAGVDIPDVMDGKSLVPLITSASPPEPSAWRAEFFFEHYYSPTRGKYIARNEGIRAGVLCATGRRRSCHETNEHALQSRLSC